MCEKWLQFSLLNGVQAERWKNFGETEEVYFVTVQHQFCYVLFADLFQLPEAMKHQHWSIIRVEGEEGSVQCPDSYLALKVDVLKEAAVMALKENTTVRIPIAVKG